MSSTTVTNTTNNFDQCIDSLVEAMNNSYLIDDEGAPIDMDDEQKANVEQTVNQVKSLVTQILEPVFSDLQKQIQDQEKRIEMLSKNGGINISHRAINSSSSSAASPISMDGLPTVDQLIAARKGKDGKKVTGYNLFTMWTMYCSKQNGAPSGFPEKGTWEKQNKEAWKVLAGQINDMSGVSTTSAAKPAAASVAVSSGGKTKGGVTAYNMYVKEYSAKNPGAPTPAKGTWNTVSKEEKQRYQEMADQEKAKRAQHA